MTTFDPSANISRMLSPGVRPVIQIIATNRCDVFHCSNCTQNLVHQRERFFMSVENFRLACESLADYPGVVGLFGGNPCTHPEFAELCRIMRETLPRRRRGLWTNNVLGHAAVIRETFGYFNLNAHGNAAHAEQMRREVIAPLRRHPEVNQPSLEVWGTTRENWHAPVLVAGKDVIGDEAALWASIETCDINRRWSGAVTQRGGELRAYFCEVAASFANMYGEDGGLEVEPGWWRRPMGDFAAQARRWCPDCGVYLRLKGHRDLEFTDDVSKTHLVQLGVSAGRTTAIHESIAGEPRTHESTDYQGLRRK